MNNQNQSKYLDKRISTPIGIVIIVLVAIIAGAGILAWQYFGTLKEEVAIQDETADWKTYRNEEYGFEIKYPSDWMCEQNVFSSKPNLVFCPFSLTEVHSGETICKWKTGASKPQYEEGMIYLFAYNNDSKPNNLKYHYLGSVSGKYYYLYSESNKLIANQIISTFRFLECSSIDIPNYEIAKNNNGNPLEFYVDLNDNQTGRICSSI